MEALHIPLDTSILQTQVQVQRCPHELARRVIASNACTNLPAEVTVVHVPNVERLRGESVRLHVHISTGYLPSKERPMREDAKTKKDEGQK